jgi:hypothetical protein
MAIGSNIGFILYGHLAEIEPVLLLHLLLLPMNLWRLGESLVPSSVRDARRGGAAQREDEPGESTGTVGRVVRGSNSEICWSGEIASRPIRVGIVPELSSALSQRTAHRSHFAGN